MYRSNVLPLTQESTSTSGRKHVTPNNYSGPLIKKDVTR